MVQFFCMFFPPLLSTTVYSRIKKSKLRLSDYVLTYCWFTILVNFFAFIILSNFLNYKNSVYSSFQISGIYAVKYLTTAIATTGAILTVLYFIQNSVLDFSLWKVKKTQHMKQSLITILLETVGGLILLLSFLLYFAPGWIRNNFNNVSVEQIIFHMNVSLKGTNIDYTKNFLKNVFMPSGILTVVLLLIFRKLNKSFLLLAVAVFIVSIFRASTKLDLGEYLSYAFNDSRFIEDNYIDPLKTNIIFPEKKRNLIYIFLESMENTYLNKNSGGAQQTNLIPELRELAEEHTNFSNTSESGGALQLPNTQWTIGAMVAQHTGLPLKLPMGKTSNNTYGDYSSFLPGCVSLGDILEKEGYQQMLMIGSEAYFGGRDDFYTQHGNYKIFDYNTARESGRFEKDYYVWWGFEDQKLFSYAKEEILKLSESEAPFNFTMLTVDTHSGSGYLCEACGNQYKEQYANVISCSSRQVGEFVSWIKNQDFYENTTIVINGDHLSMDVGFFNNLDEDYVRTTYNVIINPAVETDHTKNRLFSTVDLFPTTLASMGVIIEGDRLGLGTNLFSRRPTLIETYGIAVVEEGFRFKSNFYNKEFVFVH